MIPLIQNEYDMPLPIEDYALIGDCETAALVGRDGSIDWLCFPRFDSPACFAALLGGPEHGRWKLAPVHGVSRVTRSYRGSTLVLDTTFETETGTVQLTDFMPLRSGFPDLVRMVRGVRGQVRIRSEWAARFDYGNIVPWVRPEGTGIYAIGGPDTIHLRSRGPVTIDDATAISEFVIKEGQTESFVMNWHPSHLEIPPPIDPAGALQVTLQWWQAWAERCTYQGRYAEAVLRSLLTLKALTYRPTGGIVAAPTTSLPEQLGGPRNWDYRYCWLRDASFTLSAFMHSGYNEEAAAWRQWLLRAVAGRGSEIQIMYGLAGERRLPELSLPWLPGYEGSAPVRIGNGAYRQFQLDVFGEVLDCMHLARHYGLQRPQGGWRVEQELLAQLEQCWTLPDEGLWEVRGPQQHFTHSKLMAWVAFDRAIQDVEQFGLEGPVDHWKQLRAQLHAEICEKAYHRGRKAFTQAYGSDEVDAAVLVMPMVGFLPAQDPRFVGTVAAIEQDLLHDGFVERYRTKSGVDGLPEGEGAFLLCTFWLADAYICQGRLTEAETILDGLLAIRNDVGLLAEEYCPQRRRQLGNFPQAFSHLGLIHTARRLSLASGGVSGSSAS